MLALNDIVNARDAKSLADEFNWKNFENDSICEKALKEIFAGITSYAKQGEYSFTYGIPDYLSSATRPQFAKVMYCCKVLKSAGFSVKMNLNGGLVVAWGNCIS